MSDPNDYQVGGDHYRKVKGEQHWDRIWRLYGPEVAWVYFVGQATLYIERYRDKNGIEDLKKARHFIDKLISLEEKEGIGKRVPETGNLPQLPDGQVWHYRPPGCKPFAPVCGADDRNQGTTDNAARVNCLKCIDLMTSS